MSMERVKEIEERLEDWMIPENLFNLETTDIQFLIDTIKQQNEQIKQQAIENERVLSSKDQRIEELERSFDLIQHMVDKADFTHTKAEALKDIDEIAEQALNK